MTRNGTNRAARAAIEPLESRTFLSTASFLNSPVLPRLATAQEQKILTAPSNGDVNPYGVAFVPKGFAKGGPLQAGDVLVSNFNDMGNAQGTGTTIDRITPAGTVTTFFQGQQGIGLTTALGVLKRGFVIVGNLPTTDGTSATVQPGSILVIDRTGKQVASFSDSKLLDGPWDMAIRDEGSNAQLFVSNVLSGTVTRLNVKVTHGGGSVALISSTQIGSGFAHRPDPMALEVGPTGLVLGRHDVLYVASTVDGAIFALDHATFTRTDEGTGRLVTKDSAHLHGPLGMVQAPNGDLIVANGDAVNTDPNQPSELAEFTTAGAFVGQFSINSNNGAPFGIGLEASGNSITLAAVDNNLNQLDVFTLTKSAHSK